MHQSVRAALRSRKNLLVPAITGAGCSGLSDPAELRALFCGQFGSLLCPMAKARQRDSPSVEDLHLPSADFHHCFRGFVQTPSTTTFVRSTRELTSSFAKTWRFRPAEDNGQPIAAWYRISVVFNLKDAR